MGIVNDAKEELLMTKALIVAAALGLSLSVAGACEYQRSAEAKVDQTVVASIEAATMSTPQQIILPAGTAPVQPADAAKK